MDGGERAADTSIRIFLRPLGSALPQGFFLGVFTTSWLALGLVGLQSTPGERSDAVAVYLFGLAAVVALFAAVSATGNLLFTAVLSCATARAVLSGVYEATGSRSVDRAAGGFGVALAALAIYGGLALLLEDLRQTDVLPLFRRGEAQASLEGDLEQQLRRLEREPGVRRRL